MKSKNVFLFLFFVILIILNIFVGFFMVNFFNPVAILAFVIIQLFNILIAYRLSEFITSLIIKQKDLPKLDKLSSFPAVAFLYVTFNDAIPQILAKLKDQTYENYDIFVLDDSTDPNYRELIDRFGYKTIRRENRDGFKAGALNNWLNLFGDKYEYLIILDSDSVLEDDFIEIMVKYAEHPSNKNVAVFQSKWRIWNTTNRFPRTIASILPLQLFSFEKLANEYDTPLIVGHNNLFRIKAFKEINGFDERFVCEDLAVALDLIEKGYECKYVDVISYEATPETVRSYAIRHIRWAKGTIEVVRSETRNIPFIINLHLFMAAYSYLVYLFFIPGMFIVTFGFNSNFESALYVLELIISGQVIHTPLLYPILLISFYFIYFVFLKYPLALKLGISSKDYFLNVLLSPALDLYILLPLVKGLVVTIIGKKVVFTVTDKKMSSISVFQVFHEMKYSMLILAIILIGLIRNPIALIFNFFWIIPFMASPIVIYLIQR